MTENASWFVRLIVKECFNHNPMKVWFLLLREGTNIKYWPLHESLNYGTNAWIWGLWRPCLIINSHLAFFSINSSTHTLFILYLQLLLFFFLIHLNVCPAMLLPFHSFLPSSSPKFGENLLWDVTPPNLGQILPWTKSFYEWCSPTT